MGELAGDAAWRIAEPGACSGTELEEFARLVLLGFPGARDLERRIREARRLGFHRAAGELVGVAALKSPGEAVRRAIFEKAAAPADPIEHELDLGWVYVLPEHRGRRIAGELCRRLMDRAGEARVYSTTRVDNHPMIRILGSLGFARAGRPFSRRGQELILFLRSMPESAGVDSR